MYISHFCTFPNKHIQAIDDDLVQVLKDYQDSMCTWEQPFVIDHDGVPVDLCQAVGPNAQPPLKIKDQPDNYPNDCKYMFPKCYNGIEDEPKIRALLEAATPGCSLYTQRSKTPFKNGYTWCYKCKKYQVDDSPAKFADGNWTKDNVNVALNKGLNAKPCSPIFPVWEYLM